MTIYTPQDSFLNTYQGAVYQQTSSVVSRTNPNCYFDKTACFSVYGFEYKPGYEEDGMYIEASALRV